MNSHIKSAYNSRLYD